MENKIRALRSEMGLSQEELARRCGVSRQTINAIENNKYDPTLTPGLPPGRGAGDHGGRAVPGAGGKILLKLAGTRLQNGSPLLSLF